MQLISTVICIVLLMIVFVFDIRHRAIPLYILFLAAGSALWRLLASVDLRPALFFAGMNLLGCLSILLFAFLTLFLLKRSVFNPLTGHIGAGDLLFFPVLCLSFSPVNFIVFFVFALALMLVLKPLLFRASDQLPLAGVVAIIMAVILVVSELFAIDLYSDALVLNFVL
jgi:hypothetical protein